MSSKRNADRIGKKSEKNYDDIQKPPKIVDSKINNLNQRSNIDKLIKDFQRIFFRNLSFCLHN